MQGAVAAQPEGRLVLAADAEVALAEQLVLDVEELAAPHGEVAAPDQAHGVAAGGPVERLGHRRPPVDDDRLALLVGHGDAPDVERLDALGAGAAGGASRSMRPKTRAASCSSSWVSRLHDRLLDDVALVAGLVGAAPADLGEGPQPEGVLPRPLQAVVGVIEVRLLRLRDRGGAWSCAFLWWPGTPKGTDHFTGCCRRFW